MLVVSFLGFFMISLISHGTAINAGGALLIIIYSLVRGYFFNVDKKVIVIGVLVATFCVLQATFSLIEIGVKPSQASRDALLNNLTMSFILILFSISFISLVKFELNNVILSLKWILIINLSFFFFQFLVVYLFDYYIDAVFLFTGEESRYQNYFLQGAASSLIKYRVTGLYIEPSTYVAAMSVLATSYRILTKKISFFVLTILSCLLTFSTISFVVAFFMLLSLLNRKLLGRFLLISCVLIPILSFVFSDFIFTVVDDFALKLTLTSGSRFELLGMIYYLDDNLNLFGYGLYSVPEKIYMLSSGMAGYRIASLNDAGLINFIGMKFGLIGVFIIFILMLWKLTFQNFLMVFTVLLTKISFMFPLFIIMLMSLFAGDKLSYLHNRRKF